MHLAPPELRRARVAVFGYFFVLGAATATWSARLPAIKSALHLTDGRLGLALFAVPAGSVLTLALSGRIVDKFGDGRVLRVAGVAACATLVPIGLARGLPCSAPIWPGSSRRSSPRPPGSTPGAPAATSAASRPSPTPACSADRS